MTETISVLNMLFGLSPGVRMLRQDPTECLFSFICTSNNHISRIQGMVERLCQALGAPLCQLDQTSYHNFPSLSALAGATFFLYEPNPLFIIVQERLYQWGRVYNCNRGLTVCWVPNYIIHPLTFAFGSVVENPTMWPSFIKL